jgi:hypothetical protein
VDLVAPTMINTTMPTTSFDVEEADRRHVGDGQAV